MQRRRGSGYVVAAGEDRSAADCGCGAASPKGGIGGAHSHVYAIGRIEARFPRLDVEKEFAQVVAQLPASGLSDRQLVTKVLSQPENRYLARQMCWVLRVQGMETYLLDPGDASDLDQLISALRERPAPGDQDVVVGHRGELATPDRCNGLVLPLLSFERVYSFSRDELIAALPVPPGSEATSYRATAEAVFDRVSQLADNAGNSDEHRALNYLLVRYPDLYARVARANADNASLSAVEVAPSELGGGSRRVVDVILSFTDRATDVVDKAFVRVDVTGLFPFLVTKLAPYFDRPM